MNAAFLSDQDLQQVQSIMSTYGLTQFDASVRLWGRGKAIDVNGTLGKKELSCLLAIARFLGDRADATQRERDHDAASALPYAPLITQIEVEA